MICNNSSITHGLVAFYVLFVVNERRNKERLEAGIGIREDGTDLEISLDRRMSGRHQEESDVRQSRGVGKFIKKTNELSWTEMSCTRAFELRQWRS